MKYVSIRDSDSQGNLMFDVADVIHALGDTARQLVWRATCVEAFGRAKQQLEGWGDAGSLKSGEEFAKLADDIDQIVEGEFIGRVSPEGRILLIIRAVDSSYFDVLFLSDFAVEDALRDAFTDVSDTEEWPNSPP